MGNIFDNIPKKLSELAQFILNKKVNSVITKDQLTAILTFQKNHLDSLDSCLSVFDSKSMSTLKTLYLSKHQLKDKNYIGDIFLSMKTSLSNKALAAENKMMFGAAKICIDRYKNLLVEVLKNIDQLYKEDKIIEIRDIKISDLMIFGVITEIIIFNKCTSILFSHFSNMCADNVVNPMGYQVAYLKQNIAAYIAILNHVCNAEGIQTFIQSITVLKIKQSDINLLVENTEVSPFFSKLQLNNNSSFKVTSGIRGFNIIAHIVDKWNNYQHEKYLEIKSYKSWLEAHKARLTETLNGTDPNSEEMIQLNKIIDAYTREIANVDYKLDRYEKSESVLLI